MPDTIEIEYKADINENLKPETMVCACPRCGTQIINIRGQYCGQRECPRCRAFMITAH